MAAQQPGLTQALDFVCEITDKLARFNERVGYLVDSSLLAWLRTRGNKQPDLSRLLSGEWLVYEGLKRESLDSYFLHLRTLLQGRDGYSVKQIGEIYDHLPAEYCELATLSVQLRSQLNSCLDVSAGLRLEKEAPLSRRELLNTLLYGHFAHDDPNYVAAFKKLTGTGMFSLFSFIAFANIVITLTDVLRRMALLNKTAIEWLQEQPDEA